VQRKDILYTKKLGKLSEDVSFNNNRNINYILNHVYIIYVVNWIENNFNFERIKNHNIFKLCTD